jgi:hypothetical protein
MRVSTMSRVAVPAKIESCEDLYGVERGRLIREQVRTIEVTEAIVDTNARCVSLPRRFIQELGLRRLRTSVVRTYAGTVEFGVYGPIRLTVLGRDCLTEAVEVPDDCPVLIGLTPLGSLDFVIGSDNLQLIGNPDHNGEWMADQF